MSTDEKKLTWLLATVPGLWRTESWHGIGAAWVGLLATCITLLPYQASSVVVAMAIGKVPARMGLKLCLLPGLLTWLLLLPLDSLWYQALGML